MEQRAGSDTGEIPLFPSRLISIWLAFCGVSDLHLKTEYTGAEMGCDACNINGRIGTITVTIGGEPYDKETFQTLQDTDDEGKDEDSDVVSVFSEEKDSSDIDGDESAPQIVHSKLVMGMSSARSTSDLGLLKLTCNRQDM